MRSAAAVTLLTTAAGFGLVLRDRTGSGPRPAMKAGAPAATPGWHSISDAPISSRYDHLLIAMGSKVLVWGGIPAAKEPADGYLDDGAVYDTATDGWSEVPQTPLPAGAITAGAWTGTEAILLVRVAPDSGPLQAAAFNPRTNRWRALPSAPDDVGYPQAPGSATWTGSDLLVTSDGFASNGHSGREVATLDVRTGRWRARRPAPSNAFPGSKFIDAVWTGDELVGVGSTTSTDEPSLTARQIMAYSPSTDRWRSLGWGLPGGLRARPVVVWTGSRLFVGGGWDRPEHASTDAALLDISTGKWQPVPGAPVGFTGSNGNREGWTGRDVLSIHSGDDETGGPIAFDPKSQRWSVGPPSRSGVESTVTPWVWAGGRAVQPLGGTPKHPSEGVAVCCFTGPRGGEVYLPGGS